MVRKCQESEKEEMQSIDLITNFSLFFVLQFSLLQNYFSFYTRTFNTKTFLAFFFFLLLS